MDKELREMLDHFQIRNVLAEYCRGVDRVDEPLTRSIYAEDSMDEHGIIVAPGHEFSKLICDSIADSTDTLSHTLGQSVIKVDGDTAGAETYFIAAARGRAPDGKEVCNQLGGRFADKLVREDGKWKVKHRVVLRDWSVAIPLDYDWDSSNALRHGQRSNEDHSYAVLGTTHGSLA